MLASNIAFYTLPLADGMKDSMAWGIVILCVVLGVLVTVNPVKREKEIKGRKQ